MEEIRMMDVLIDLNILLDVFLVREPWLAESRAIWDAHHHRSFVGHLAAHGLTNLFYIARRYVGNDQARAAVRLCLQTFEIVPVGRPELEKADTFSGWDFEDNLVMGCASIARLDAIVTRDPKGFVGSPLPVYSPAALLARLSPGDVCREG